MLDFTLHRTSTESLERTDDWESAVSEVDLEPETPVLTATFDPVFKAGAAVHPKAKQPTHQPLPPPSATLKSKRKKSLAWPLVLSLVVLGALVFVFQSRQTKKDAVSPVAANKNGAAETGGKTGSAKDAANDGGLDLQTPDRVETDDSASIGSQDVGKKAIPSGSDRDGETRRAPGELIESVPPLERIVERMDENRKNSRRDGGPGERKIDLEERASSAGLAGGAARSGAPPRPSAAPPQSPTTRHNAAVGLSGFTEAQKLPQAYRLTEAEPAPFPTANNLENRDVFYAVVLAAGADLSALRRAAAGYPQGLPPPEVLFLGEGSDPLYALTAGHYTNRNTAFGAAQTLRGYGYQARVVMQSPRENAVSDQRPQTEFHPAR